MTRQNDNEPNLPGDSPPSHLPLSLPVPPHLVDHVIRLRGPWQYRVLARTVLLPDGTTKTEDGELPPPGRVQMPADWGDSLGPDFRGRVLYTRRFGCPTGLEAGDRVVLHIERADAFAQVRLNNQRLGPIPPGGEPARFDMTQHLVARNQLNIEIELPRLTGDSPTLPRPGREILPGGLIGEVRLEIVVADGL